MRVLWITNTPIAKHREMLGYPLGQSGGWMEAAYCALKEHALVSLGVVTLYGGNEIQKESDGNNSFYLIPSKESIENYNPDSSFNKGQWKNVLNDFKPDVIQLWGTEYAHGLCALKVSGGIPSVVYMQGMMSQILNHTFAGISLSDRLCSTTFADLIKGNTYWKEQSINRKKARNEAIILRNTNGVIVENDWCADNCRIISSKCKVFKSLLPINPLFSKYEWCVETMSPYTIFTTAGANPIKGHHILLKALALIVKQYPQTMLYIPGESYYFDNSLNRSIKRLSYPNYLLKLIRKMKLEKNVTFIGRLTPEQMADNMQKCNVFAMPSAIENHSSTLIEAMMVGAPCVSSYVGGISDYLSSGQNGLLYRFDEPEVLAAKILRIFANRDYARHLSDNAKKTTRTCRCSLDLAHDFYNIYLQLNNG